MISDDQSIQTGFGKIRVSPSRNSFGLSIEMVIGDDQNYLNDHVDFRDIERFRQMVNHACDLAMMKYIKKSK